MSFVNFVFSGGFMGFEARGVWDSGSCDLCVKAVSEIQLAVVRVVTLAVYQDMSLCNSCH